MTASSREQLQYRTADQAKHDTVWQFQHPSDTCAPMLKGFVTQQSTCTAAVHISHMYCAVQC
jgi:hypothetical protein